MEAKIKHLEMILAIINRMAANSFMLKRWSVILVAALFALAAPDKKPLFVYVAYLPTLMFWGLDGFFLRQEQLFRKLYDEVRVINDEEAIDFSMNTGHCEARNGSWISVCFSKTLFSFHGIMVLTLVLVTGVVLA